MAELPDIKKFECKPVSGRGGTLQGLPEADRRKFVNRVEYLLSELSDADRRAFEHRVWHATVGRFGTPEHRALGPASGCIRATATYVYMLVEEALASQRAARARESSAQQRPAAARPLARDWNFQPQSKAEALLAADALRKEGKHDEANQLMAAFG